jgi:hypothetical protein
MNETTFGMKICLTLSLFFWAALIASAQPESPSRRGGTVSANYSFSSSSELEQNGTKMGDIEVSHVDLGYNTRAPLSKDTVLFASFQWSREDLIMAGNVPLPEQLESLRLRLGITQNLQPNWKISLMVSPSVAGEFVSFSASEFNLGGTVMFLHETSKELSWSFGLTGSTRGKYHLLPALGLRWNWAPDWTLTVGFPVTSINYQATPDLTLKCLISVHGGSYHIDEARAPGLGDTYLQYREIRAGVSATYHFNDMMSLELEGGSVLDQSFDYYDRDYNLNGGKTVYFNLGLKFRL